MALSKIVRTFAPAIEKYSGVEQLVARQAHNLEVACSSPASATIKCRNNLIFRELRQLLKIKVRRKNIHLRAFLGNKRKKNVSKKSKKS